VKVDKTAKNSGANARFYVFWRKHGSWYGSDHVSTTSRSWTRKTVLGSVPEDATEILAGLYHHPSGTTGGNAFFRHVQVENGETITPYAKDPTRGWAAGPNRLKIDGGEVLSGTIGASEIDASTVLADNLLATSAHIESELQMPASGAINIANSTTGGILLGDFSLSGSGAESGTLWSSDLSVSNNGQKSETKTYSVSTADVTGWTLVVEMDYDIDISPDASGEVTLEINCSNGQSKTASTGSIAFSSEGTLTATINLGSHTSSIDVTRTVRASADPKGNGSSTATAEHPASVDISNARDFIGPEGTKWRDSTDSLMVEISGGPPGKNVGSGDIWISGNYLPSSDRRLKSGIAALEDPIDRIMGLAGRTYQKNGRPGAGLVAQEVEGVFDEIVREGEYYSLNYDGLHALHVEVEKDHEKRIRKLEKENERLRRQMKQD
jgi:hypothetical protein